MKRVLIFILLFHAFRVSAQLSEAVQVLQHTPGLQHAAIGISVKRVQDGQVICRYNGDVALTPASVTKLFSTAFALQLKGPEFVYSTVVTRGVNIIQGVLEGNIIIHTGGDPCLDSKYFPKHKFLDTLVYRIKSLGIKRIRGKLMVRGVFDRQIPGSWPWEDVANYYGALYHTFNYQDNTYRIQLSTCRDKDSVCIVAVKPEIPGGLFCNQVVFDASKPSDVWLYGGPFASKIVLRGSIASKSTIFTVKGAMHHPDEVFLWELRKRLEQEGIRVDGDDFVDDHACEILRVISPRLREIIFYTNKKSVNLFAEAMGGLVDTNSFEKGVKRCLAAIEIDTSGIILKDACGLSPLNAIPADVCTDLLVWGHSRLDSSFLYSLPMGGVDRGVHVYADHSLLGKRLRAKTGSLSGVRALAGYLTTQNGDLYAFTILLNHYTCTSKEVQRAVRTFLVTLCKNMK